MISGRLSAGSAPTRVGPKAGASPRSRRGWSSRQAYQALSANRAAVKSSPGRMPAMNSAATEVCISAP
jgi:hypothetical protein